MKKIKSIILYKHDYVLKDINSEEFELKGGMYNKTAYDEEGRTLSELKFDAKGGIEQHYEYTYNEQGVKTAEKSFDENGDMIDDMEFSVDVNGKVLFGYKNYLDGSKDTITYRYDEAGKLIEKEERNDDDEVEFLDRLVYEGDNEVLHESLDEEKELVYRKETTYNEKGDVLEEKTWSQEADDSIKMVNHYDDKGELVGVESFNGAGELMFKVDYDRDDEGHVSLVHEQSPGRNITTEFEYDEKGNAIVQVEINADGEINSRTERSFDEDGNVTESEAILDHHGMGLNQHYVLKYEYEFYA